MASYYSDFTLGDDTGTGEIGDPWKYCPGMTSWAGSATLSANDTVYFKKTEEWRDQLTVNASGSSGNPITFAAYGSGVDPIINGSDLVTGWSDASPPANVWSATFTRGSAPRAVFFDGVAGVEQVSKAAISGAGEWFWEANVLYIYYTEDPDGAVTIEASNRSSCIYTNNPGEAYITIQNLHLTRADSDGLTVLGGADNIILDNCEVSKNGRFGAILSNCTNIKISNCAVYDTVKEEGIYLSDATAIVNGATIENCTIYNNEENGLLLDNVENLTVRYCYIYSNGTSLQGSAGNGIQCVELDGADIYYNIVKLTNNNTELRGIDVGNSAQPCANTRIYNNIIYGGTSTYGLLANDGCTTGMVFKNNIAYMTADNLPIVKVTNSGGGTWDYNCYYSTGNYTNGWHWNGSDYSTFANWQSGSNQDDNSINSDPLFITAGSDFHLQPNSPCINAGTDVGLTEDYAGNTVPLGSAVDIGAYEAILNFLYNKGREAFLAGDIDWANDTIKAVLVDSADYTLSLTTHDFLNDIPAAGQVAISDALAGKSATLGVADASDLTIATVSGDKFEYIILFKDTGDSTTSPLIMCIGSAVGLPFTPDGGNVTLKWSDLTNKIFKL